MIKSNTHSWLKTHRKIEIEEQFLNSMEYLQKKKKKKKNVYLLFYLMVKVWCFAPKFINKSRTSTVHHSYSTNAGSSNQSKKKETKRHTDRDRINRTVPVYRWHNCLCRKARDIYQKPQGVQNQHSKTNCTSIYQQWTREDWR